MRWLIALALLTVGCGSSPTSPSPQPVPTPTPAPAPAFTGTVTDTVTGAPISGYSAILVGSRLTLSAPGYLTRETANGPTVDLIPEAAPFDLSFYRQLVRNEADAPGAMQPLRRLTQAPAIYLQTTGLSAATIDSLHNFANVAVSEFSGRTMGVTAWETGDTLRLDRAGWITVELVPVVSEDWCGRAQVALSAGHVQLNVDPRYQDRSRAQGCHRPLGHTLAHELGHALGFFHVADPNSLMSGARPLSHSGVPSALERYHAAIAYKRPIGNTDVDKDPASFSGLNAAQVVVD